MSGYSTIHAQSINYEFTNGSMAPTLNNLPAGVIASNFSIGTFSYSALIDNGGNGNSIRLSRNDIGTSSTNALAGPYLSFSLTIPSGININLNSLSLDYTSNGLTNTEYINARIFTNIDGFDDLVGDTIGTLGRVANGANSGTMSISLVNPTSNVTKGTNINNGDFNNLTNRTVVFYLPFIRDSQTTATDYLDIDNITLHFTNASAPPLGIASVIATTINSFEVALSWIKNITNENGFIIERSIVGSNSWETIITTEADVTSIRDKTISSGISYSYRISAILEDGSVSPSTLSNPVAIPNVSTTPMNIMPLGDSITQGAGAGGGYRSPLYGTLSNAAFTFQYTGARTDNPTTILTNAGQTYHEGHGSYSTDLLLGNLDTTKPYGGTNEGGYWITGISGTRAPTYPDIILLMIGTNDIGMWAQTPEQTIAYYDQLLTKLTTLRPSARIICSSVVPFVLSYFENAYPDKVGVYTNREPNNMILNSMLPALVASHEAVGHRVQFYDMRQKISTSNAPTLIGGDGVHPNQSGYNAIASGWFDAIKQLPIIESWRILHFNTAASTGNSADLADPDGDGNNNLMEYALGTNPNTLDHTTITASSHNDTGISYLEITFPRRKNSNIYYITEVSTNLNSWATDTMQIGTPISISPDFEQVTFRDRQPISANQKRFMRIKIVKP